MADGIPNGRRPDDSPDSVMDFDNARKQVGIEKLKRIVNEVESMTPEKLKAACNDPCNTPSQCLKRFQAAAGTLTARFKRTTNVQDGGAEFCKDINELERNAEVLQDAGVSGIHHVSYEKEEGRKRRKR